MQLNNPCDKLLLQMAPVDYLRRNQKCVFCVSHQRC